MSGVVIYMEERRRTIAPKVEAGVYMGQRYTLQFDPNAPSDERWMWVVTLTRKYEYVGSAATLDKAARAAKKKIKELVER